MIFFLDTNICLDLLDTTRPTSPQTVEWYLEHKDDTRITFYFTADAITTIYYILTERRRVDPLRVVEAIDALSAEITPFYLNPSDFVMAKHSYYEKRLDDFEDLMVLHSAVRARSATFVTHDTKVGNLGQFETMVIENIRAR